MSELNLEQKYNKWISGIYHNTGCSGISFGVKLKDFGYDVEPLSFTSYIRHYKWYYSGVVDRWCHFY
jgi:hypothetical protein